MQPQDEEALEQAAWRDFVAGLTDHLAGTWPAMPERLGDRYPAFVELAIQQAEQRGFRQVASICRFVNLWFVWGPAYHDKPGFEWAQAILSTPHEREWVTVHQLVQRSLAELRRLPGARIEPQVLEAADERVLQAFGRLGRRGEMRPREAPPLPRKACDLEAAELRLVGEPWLNEYLLQAGEWRRQTAAVPPPVRVNLEHPMPKTLALLSCQRGQGPVAKLQARLRAHASCDGDRHPAAWFAGPHGRWDWAGHETRAVSWPAATRTQPLPLGGPASAIAELTSPEPHRLKLDCCGLRDEGEPLGALEALVEVYPAEQWWLELQRPAPSPQTLLPPGRPWARGSTRCRVERDGTVIDAPRLRAFFDEGLDGAVGAGLARLAGAWVQVPGLTQPRAEASFGVLCGRMAATWGWRHDARGMAVPPLMRLVAALELDACTAELEFGGELLLGSTRSRITLRLAGTEPLRTELRREAAEPAMGEVMKAAVAHWRWPFVLGIEPQAADSAGLLQQLAPASGALVGEAGLRPCTHGSSGWEWYVQLRIEPVAVPLCTADPLLGDGVATLPLMPAMTLVDWSLG